MQYLRESTASQEISLGQFLDSTDGNTEENGLTIANTDIKLRKHGTTTLASKNSGGATSISNGVYHATLDATDSNTLGMLEVYVHVAGALAVKSTYNVIPVTVFDAMFVDQLTGPYPKLGISESGTAQAATATTLQLRSASTFADDQVIGSTIVILTATAGAGQSKIITDYVSSTDTATVDTWVTTPTGTITYMVIPTPPGSESSPIPSSLNSILGTALTETTASRLADNLSTFLDNADANTVQVLDDVGGGSGLDAAATRTALGMAAADLDTQLDAIVLDTAEIGTAGAGLTNINLPNQTMDITGSLSGSVGSVTGGATASALATVDTNVDAIKAKTDDLTFTKANELDTNTQSINGAGVTGDGNATPWDGA